MLRTSHFTRKFPRTLSTRFGIEHASVLDWNCVACVHFKFFIILEIITRRDLHIYLKFIGKNHMRQLTK